MAHLLTASVAVENTAYSFDKLFDYLIPEALTGKVVPGCRVLVSFGRGSKKRQGFVFSVSDSPENGTGKLKKISEVLDEKPLLSDEMLKIASFLADRTFCTYFDAAKSVLPSGIYLRVSETFMLSPDYTDDNPEELSPEEQQIVSFLRKKDKLTSDEKIYKELGLSPETKLTKKLYEKGILIKNVDTFRRINDAKVKIVSLAEELQQEGELPFKPTPKQKLVIDLLRNIGSATSKEISYYTGVAQAVIENLHKKGVLVYDDMPVYRTPSAMRNTPRKSDPIVLSEMQNNAYERLCALRDKDEAAAALLYGVTGSGKTKVYMKLIDDVAGQDKGVIVLVPEIALTPQLLSMFYARYGEKVAVIHSGLSQGERLDEWKRIANGEATIAVGTRSASFAPVKNLSMIIIDEEQEGSYKSEMTPRYHARDVARFRCAYNNALLVLASATPSVESFAYAQNGRYELIELSERYSKTGLPSVVTVDVSDKENMNGMHTISAPLADEIRQNLENKQQTILLINRRGYNTFVACTKCKSVASCPNCSISLTYHTANDRLMCHYCGYSESVRTTCNECGADTIKFSGFGTQRVQQELEVLFPDAKILRMDADTTSAKNSHEKSFRLFAQGEYDIMVGTQMVAKGLDFPDVTLVGVISVDQQLYNDDFRSTERAFDLLTQVVGRSGRGEKSGRAVIQTLAPENAVIELAAEQDYTEFYKTEIAIRKALVYPPFCDICVVGFSAPSENMVKTAAGYFFRMFKEKLQANYPDEKVIVLGPVAPKLAKINNSFRERLIIKCRNSAHFRNLISECLKAFATNKYYSEKVTAYADMNPDSLY
ncbi:MAG: primosomal protein N' [Clostridia bacterium]|nr:primosomal protein N' [Clostridia bacterium]